MKIKKLLQASLLLLLANQASAITISGGETFNVDWFVDLDNTVTTSDLTATSTWTVSSYSSSSIVLDITIANTTLLDLPTTLTEAAIVSFGLGVDPDATATLTTSGSVFDMVGVGSNQNFPGGFKNIDICLFADGCTGGSVNNGLQAGSSDSLQITLTALTSFGASTDLLFFPAKFQTTLGSFEPGGTTTVPEPTMVGLLAIGLLGMLVARRRMKV